MSFKSIQKQRIEKTKKLYNNIIKERDKKARDLQEYLDNKINENFNWQEEFDEVKDRIVSEIYKSLRKTYLLTLDGVYDIYGIDDSDRNKSINSIERKVIDEYTYVGDGKTIEERIEEHCDYYAMRDIKDSDRIFNDMSKILNTETVSVMTNTLDVKVKNEFEYVAIEEGSCCGICAEYIEQGVLLEEDFELPPYHPNCECIAVHFSSEEVEDMNI